MNQSLLIVHISSRISLASIARKGFEQFVGEANAQDPIRATSPWSLLNWFSGETVSDQLRGQKIDSLENVLMLEKNHHDKFGSMRLWFTERPVQPITTPTDILILVS
jgi:hypothetical protein